MMSKSKALVFSLGAPLLYYVMQIVASMAALIYFTADALRGQEIPTEQVEILEFTVAMVEKSLAATLPIMLATFIMFVGVLLIVHRKKTTSLWKSIGMTRNISINTLLLAALAGLAFHIACQGFIEAIPVPQTWQDANQAVGDALIDPNNMWFTVLMLCFLIPIVEEIAFRGFAQRILHHAFLPWTAVVLQGLIFGIFHANALQTIYTFATGLIIGYIYMKTQNLWASIVFHMAYNGANFLLDGLIRLFGGNVEVSALVLALMAAGGTTLALLFVRSIKGTVTADTQKEME